MMLPAFAAGTLLSLAMAAPSEAVSSTTLASWWTPEGQSGPRLVTFWSVTCGDCREELPTLAAWTERHFPGRVTLVQLDVPERRGAVTDATLAAWGDPPWRRMHLDEDRPSDAAARVVPAWTRAVPTHVLFDGDGHEIGRWVEALPPRRRLRQALVPSGR